MRKALKLYDTTIGKKAAMAASGIILIGFTLGHLSGNLKAFAGAESFNEYSRWLRTVPLLLWGTRLALLFAFVTHIHAALTLLARNRAARPVRYHMKEDVATTYAAKAMVWTGPVLLFYVLFHLAHLTFGGQLFGGGHVLGIAGYTWEPSNPYNNMVRGFQHVGVVVPYVLGVLALGMHLAHGFEAMFQSLGASHPRYDHLRRQGARVLAGVLVAGFLSIPLAVQAGLLEPTTQTFNFPELL